MDLGWTGGQYSALRALLGLYLVARFAGIGMNAAGLFPPGIVLVILGAMGAGVLLALGLWHRPAALGLAVAWAWLFDRTPWIPLVDLVVVECLLLAHLLLPPAPYGSIAARGRPDPGGGWRMPAAPYAVTWVIAAAAWAWEGYAILAGGPGGAAGGAAAPAGSPIGFAGLLAERLGAPQAAGVGPALAAAAVLQIGVAAGAAARPLRPWVWLVLVAGHAAALLQSATFRPALLLLDLLLLDPGWVRPGGGRAAETLFYDGHCGLCHGFVRFLLAEDRGGEAFRFSPLQGAAFGAAVPQERRADLPDSLILKASGGALLLRSAAVLHALDRLGGFWRVLGRLAALVPRRLRDLAYDGVARVRHRLFRRPEETCPILPEGLRARFDA